MVFIRRMGITVHSGWPAWFTSTASALFQLIFEAALGWYFREGKGVVWCHLNKTESWNMMVFVRFLEGREEICFKNLQPPSSHKSILPRDKQQGWDHWAARMNRDLTDTAETRVWLLPRSRMKWNSIHCIVSSSPSPRTPLLCYLGCKPGWAGALALATAQETCFRSSRDDVVVSFWMLVPDLCFIPAHDRLSGTLLVCYQKLLWVC